MELNEAFELLRLEYLRISGGNFNKIIPIESLGSNSDNIIEEFLNQNYINKFKIELLMLPNWANKSKKYKILNDFYTHIRFKK